MASTPVPSPTIPLSLEQALAFSHYAQRMVHARPEYRVTWDAAPIQTLDWHATVTQPIEQALASDNADLLDATLRQTRQHVMLHTLARDLTGIADLDEVCRTMGRLAETSLSAALNFHQTQLQATRGIPRGATTQEAQSLIIIAMGKLGGGELNVSSDIDLIFTYPEAGDTDGSRPLSNHEFFVRLGQRVIASLNDITADGFVFRVDMRLRPYGDASPLALPFDALEQYLTTQGRMWERYAWLKAHPLTGDHHDMLMQLVTPFVYRKYLDYDAYAGLRDVREQIREQGKTRGFAHNIKLGSGGIRDIEFIAQALQIVRGGRVPALQQRSTRAALRALGERALLDETTVQELLTAYDFLRRVEHRLQYRDDLATQTLPDSDDERQALARSMGFSSRDAFETTLDAQRACVASHFDTLLGDDDAPAPAAASTAFIPTAAALHSAMSAAPEKTTATTLSALPWSTPEKQEIAQRALTAQGFADPVAVIERIVRSRESRRYTTLPERSQQRFDALACRLIDVARYAASETAPLAASAAIKTAGSHVSVDTLFQRLFAFLETISRRSAYLALLSEHPHILPTLARLFAASSWAADYLNRHPILLDELISPAAAQAEPDWLAWRQELSQMLTAHEGDTERQMDELRHFQHAQTFRLLTQDLAGRLTVERLADHLTALADLILELTLGLCWRLLTPSTTATTPRFAIIGYGKLGSKELSYGSDLDLVFLYDAEPDDTDAFERYAKLAQRMNTWLTSTTAAGGLYSTDLRLRPDGSSGLLVSRWDAFVRYQREKAWTFEHQALTRARFIAGDTELGSAFMRERAELLQRSRELDALRHDVVTMRARMHESHTPNAETFNVKHDRGGMIDIEFIVQFLVLAHAHRYPTLTRNTGNVALLTSAATLELISAAEAESAIAAYRHYRRLQHAVQLQEQEVARVDPALCAQQRAGVETLWNKLLDQ